MAPFMVSDAESLKLPTTGRSTTIDDLFHPWRMRRSVGTSEVVLPNCPLKVLLTFVHVIGMVYGNRSVSDAETTQHRQFRQLLNTDA